MDTLQTAPARSEAAPQKIVAPKPRSVINIERIKSSVNKRETSEAVQQDQKELERLNTLSDKAKNACDKAFQIDDTKEFDDLI